MPMKEEYACGDYSGDAFKVAVTYRYSRITIFAKYFVKSRYRLCVIVVDDIFAWLHEFFDKGVL